MKVLHALESFLPVSENWIYPQITRVRGAQPGVLCGGLQNLDLFPLNGAPRFHRSAAVVGASGLSAARQFARLSPGPGRDRGPRRRPALEAGSHPRALRHARLAVT